jgi:hypothetical protein
MKSWQYRFIKSNFLSVFVNIELSNNQNAVSNMKPSRGELMALPEIMDKPIGADEIPKIATF